jgi:hypothetical protein
VDLTIPDDDGRVLGTIEHYGDPVHVTIPADVEKSQAFTIEVITYGGGCISQGNTEVQVDGLEAVVAPYDHDVSYQLPEDTVCTAELRLFTHRASIRFDRIGTASVSVYGMKKPGREIVTRRYTVEVRGSDE